MKLDVHEEAAKLDPDIPFRASPGHRGHTWAKTYYFIPELYIQPQSLPELRKVVKLASKCRRRISLIGCGHSPSDLICTSSWLVNIDHLEKVLSFDTKSNVVTVEAGIRLHQLGAELRKHGMAIQNLGSIDNQSLAGAISTATHGSSLKHGLLSKTVLGLKIMLADGTIKSCSKDENEDLFRAALVSLGALGIIIEITFEAASHFNIEWDQTLLPLDDIITDWESTLWTSAEFTRVWWMPYMKKCIRWRAHKTSKPISRPHKSWIMAKLGFHTYQALLYLSLWFPSILPRLEQLVLTIQYGYSNQDGVKGDSGVEDGHKGLLMDCLFSQFVNEWAIPLSKGPEALIRLSAWLNGESGHGIPFSSKNLYVHAPIEVRVSDTTTTSTAHPRPFLDNTNPQGPTLYLNATLYRPYHTDPACKARYYEAFEYLMKELGGRPHWAKNFSTLSMEEMYNMYPELGKWVRVRNEVDPEGIFVGDWHGRFLLPGMGTTLAERVVRTRRRWWGWGGGVEWVRQVGGGGGGGGRKALSSRGSSETFDMVSDVDDDNDEEEEEEGRGKIEMKVNDDDD